MYWKIDIWIDRDIWMNGKMDGWRDGWMNGWEDLWPDEHQSRNRLLALTCMTWLVWLTRCLTSFFLSLRGCTLVCLFVCPSLSACQSDWPFVRLQTCHSSGLRGLWWGRVLARPRRLGELPFLRMQIGAMKNTPNIPLFGMWNELTWPIRRHNFRPTGTSERGRRFQGYSFPVFGIFGFCGI